ncbi:MAG: hypothetical protein Q4D85_09710 [Corynebacterium sp.]|uniref:hypothetical protein n=1 Tax=Corynebacterium sp. TaxID=1720 RepID=UPI0026DB2120|nr:hypothetical protein [Corynebacterium sp.]MDO5099019.1 hypothetical protein [Corynebacterium sp.]
MDTHYEFTGETCQHAGRTLHRIRTLKDIPAVGAKAYDIGGWIESPHNLPYGINPGWVTDDAKVYGAAQITTGAVIGGQAEALDEVLIANKSVVGDNARIHGWSQVLEGGRVGGNAQVHGRATVKHHAQLFDNAEAYDDAVIADGARVYGNSRVFGFAHVSGNVDVKDFARVWGHARVVEGMIYDDAQVSGTARVTGFAHVLSSAEVTHSSHIFTLYPMGRALDTVTMYRTIHGGHMVAIGFSDGTPPWCGSVIELAAKAQSLFDDWWSHDGVSRELQQSWLEEFTNLVPAFTARLETWALQERMKAE